MLITEMISDELLTIKCNYSSCYVDRFRKIHGARFDNQSKVWIVPMYSFETYEDLFEGEIIYKTPRWIICNEPAPDFSSMYKVDESIVYVPQMKLEPFDYQKFGIKFLEDRLLTKRFAILADSVGIGSGLQVVIFMI